MAVSICLSGSSVSDLCSSGRPIVRTAGEDGGRAVVSIRIGWDSGSSLGGGAEDDDSADSSFIPLTTGSAGCSGLTNMEGMEWSGNVFRGRSGGGAESAGSWCEGPFSGIGDEGSSLGGRGGRGLRAPGEVRYVISCKHLRPVSLTDVYYHGLTV